MNFKSPICAIFLVFSTSSCSQVNSSGNIFFALNKFEDPIFESSIPQVKKIEAGEDFSYPVTDFSLTEEQERALKEAEALLKETTISIND